MDKLEEVLKKIQDEVAALVDKIKSSLSKKNDENEPDNEEDKTESKIIDNDIPEVSDSEESKKKFDIKNIKIDSDFIKENGLKIFLVVAIAYLAVDEFLLKSNPEQVTSPEVTARQKPKKKVKRKKTPVKKPVSTVTKSTTSKKKKRVAKIAEKKEEKSSKDEEAFAYRENKKEVIKAKMKDIPPETSTVVLEKRKMEKENDLEQSRIDSGQEVKYDLNKDKKEMGLGEQADVKKEMAIGEQIESVISNKMKEEEKSPDYIEPPTYQRFGRGLVYNCKGKHWACVDHYSYVKCRENDKFNTENKKKKECVVRNTYASSDDCIKVQTYFTNNNEKTDFCSTEI